METKQKTYTKKELVETLKKQIASNGQKALHALEVVYSFQTETEKEEKITKEDNGWGFTGFDAEFLTSLYNSWKKYGKLSEKQMNFLKKNMVKYCGQLIDNSIVEEKIIKLGRGKYVIA